MTGLNNGCLNNVDESAPLALNPPFYAPYTQSKALAEKLVAEGSDDATATVIVRPRMVWGQGDTTLLPGIIEAVRSGALRWFTPPPVTSTCHVDNLSEGMVLAARSGAPGRAYFLTDGDPVDLRGFLSDYLATQRVPTDRVGTAPARLAGCLAAAGETRPGAGSGRRRRPPASRQMLGLLAQSVVVRDARARAELGYTAHVTRSEGLARMSPPAPAPAPAPS